MRTLLLVVLFTLLPRLGRTEEPRCRGWGYLGGLAGALVMEGVAFAFLPDAEADQLSSADLAFIMGSITTGLVLGPVVLCAAAGQGPTVPEASFVYAGGFLGVTAAVLVIEHYGIDDDTDNPVGGPLLAIAGLLGGATLGKWLEREVNGVDLSPRFVQGGMVLNLAWRY